MEGRNISLGQGARIAKLLLLAVVVAGCASLESNIQDAYLSKGAPGAYYVALEAYDDDSEDAEARSYAIRYANEAIRKAESDIDYLLANHEYDVLLRRVYRGKHSVAEIEASARARNLNIISAESLLARKEEVFAQIDVYYNQAIAEFESGNLEESMSRFRGLGDWKQSASYRQKIKTEWQYQKAVGVFEAGDYKTAHKLFCRLPSSYKDVKRLRNVALEAATVKVLVQISGNSAATIEQELVQELNRDAYIDADSRRNRRSGLYVRDYDVLISGIASYVEDNDRDIEEANKRAWILTDRTQSEVIGDSAVVYFRVGIPLNWWKVRETKRYGYKVDLDVEFMRNDRAMYRMKEDYIERSTYRYYDYERLRYGSQDYGPEYFSLRNPRLDTLGSRFPGRPPTFGGDASFRRNFEEAEDNEPTDYELDRIKKKLAAKLAERVVALDLQ